MSTARKRKYQSPLRQEQAAQTRRRILEAALDVFLQQGFAAASMSAIATAAGVSRETVYTICGSKASLLKAVYDVAVVGDHEQAPVADRDVYQAMLTDPDADSAARTFGRLSADLLGRIGPVVRVLTDARGEPELVELFERTRLERLNGTRQLLATLSGTAPHGEAFERAVDVVWALISPEVALLLVDHRGWSLETYGDWLGEEVARQVRRLAGVPDREL